MPTDQTVQEDAASNGRRGASRSAAAPEDLSAAIAAAVEKLPGDSVRCTHVSGNRYRCNWWSAQTLKGYDNPGMVGLLVTTHRVRKSLFLRVSRTPAGIAIDVDEACRTSALEHERQVLPE